MKTIIFNRLVCRKAVLLFAFLLSISTLAFAQPSNDNCNNYGTLSSNITCIVVQRDIQGATASSGIPAGCAPGGTHYDIWYRFTATNNTHTVTISNRESGFSNPAIQLFSGGCGSLVSLVCGTTTLTRTGLTVGNNYYIRISNVGAPIPSLGKFDICITHPPTYDECAGATNLTSGTSCNNSSYSMEGATASPGIPVGCAPAGALSDRWFMFTAVRSTHTVTISNRESNFNNPGLQIFSGTCASLTSLFCGTTTVTATGLTIGSVYYVRVFKTGGNITSNGDFDICVTHPNSPTNDDCVNATTLTSNYDCNTTTGNMRYATSNGPAGACAGTLTTTYDVWYRFQANATMHAVRVFNLGINLSAATTYIEVLSGVCGALTSLSCQTAATRDTVAGLVPGTFYYVRVYVISNPTASSTSDWNFSICIQNPPANDNCSGAVTLTSGATCNSITGYMDLATVGTVPVGCFGAGTYWDVWYQFVATAVSHTVTLSNVGSIFTAPRMQIYSGNCGALVSLSCVTGLTIIQAGLTIGNTYYIRVANNANPWTTGTNDEFSICVTATPAPPANDNCSSPNLLQSALVCNNTGGTLIRATATVPQPAGACGLASAPDVWYSFVAQSGFPQIRLSAIGANMQTNGRMQLLTGATCATLTAVGACWSFPAAASGTYTPGAPGLMTGQTYYIRITHNTLAAPTTVGTYTWNICIVDPDPGTGATVNKGKSYVNINDREIGGTNQPGDTLEIRATLVITRSIIGTLTRTIDSLAYYDTLRAGAGFRYVPNSLALRTNEGKLFRPSNSTYFTDLGSDADAGWITTAGAGSDTSMQINMGTGATRTARGSMASNSFPSFYGNTCIVMATYRIVINRALGTQINFGGGAFRYRDQTTGTYYTQNFPNDSLMVYDSPLSCPNNLSNNNVIGDEVNGTFGAATSAQNRAASPAVDFIYTAIAASQPDDNYYSIVNNTSANGSTSQTVAKPSAAGVRVHTVFDISGDHSGATNQARGNSPCNNGLPISAANPCGYMLLINAAYQPTNAFDFVVSGACTETYYEISAWFKNVCYKCGCDSAGRGSGTAGYIPTEILPGPDDSTGVRPNIAVQINGVDYYATGDLRYQGLAAGTQTGSDTLNNWVRRSFVYKTNPGQTSFQIEFRNNAPGGGGNDWAIDDISIRTCYPNMIYSPSSNPSVCAGQTITIRDTVRSYYNVYIYYKWQRSTNGGITWVDLAGSSGVATTVWNGSAYEFVNAYTVPPAYTTPANNGDFYRMVVATSASNLANGLCSYSESTSLTLTVISNCIDIDDDNDGIPDYVELNNPVALQDADLDGLPNWSDPSYVPFLDVNADGFNDHFDPGADVDGDGFSNYIDANFPGFTDGNFDGVNDNMDRDQDGVPNHLDLDSDNDGIPDVVESYGVDTNGNGIIDNYVDTDFDGFSQNVDANATGVTGSNIGLGAPDFDGDGVANYLDTDSDNDGIPDAIEVAGPDVDNDGKLDNFIDANADGISDNNVNATALLPTGVDLAPVNGRADNWPFKNLDRDLRPNAYDVDSDGDGIVDVIEGGLPDVNLNGIVDGVIGTNGWSTSVSGLVALNLRTTDGDGSFDFLDIDADNDGIPDNIEGMTTAGYALPTLVDADGDGLMNPYDNLPAGFSGAGIFVYDHNSNGTPDYRDSDADGDGLIDRVEGNDFNLNGEADDDVVLTGLDTDGDGLDNKFDSLNSVTNIKGTSYRMGTGGTFTGDAAPGSRTTVQRTMLTQINRDWRFAGLVLPVQFLSFTAANNNNNVSLNWTIIAEREVDRFEIERSTDNSNYLKITTVTKPVLLQVQQSFSANDDITNIKSEIIYYRLKVIGKDGLVKYSNVVFVRKKQTNMPVNLMPNPASSYVNVNLYIDVNTNATIMLIDKVGKRVLVQNEKLTKGYNNISLNLDNLSEGVYAVMIETASEKIVKQLIIVR